VLGPVNSGRRRRNRIISTIRTRAPVLCCRRGVNGGAQASLCIEGEWRGDDKRQ
jgi:hypothetical protein